MNTIWQREKMLVNSIFSFTHIVFYSIKDNFLPFELPLINRPQTLPIWTGQNFVIWYRVNKRIKSNHLQSVSLAKWLAVFLSAVQVFWKHYAKRRNCSRRETSPFPQCFLPVWRAFCQFQQNLNCRLQPL